MKANSYNWFANQADENGLDAAIELAKIMGMAVKMIACFVRLYTGK